MNEYIIVTSADQDDTKCICCKPEDLAGKLSFLATIYFDDNQDETRLLISASDFNAKVSSIFEFTCRRTVEITFKEY